MWKGDLGFYALSHGTRIRRGKAERTAIESEAGERRAERVVSGVADLPGLTIELPQPEPFHGRPSTPLRRLNA